MDTGGCPLVVGSGALWEVPLQEPYLGLIWGLNAVEEAGMLQPFQTREVEGAQLSWRWAAGSQSRAALSNKALGKPCQSCW